MSPETTRKLVDVLIAFIIGSGLLYGAEWVLPRVTEKAKVKAKEVLDTSAGRRARSAVSRQVLKGSWSLRGVAGRIAPNAEKGVRHGTE